MRQENVKVIDCFQFDFGKYSKNLDKTLYKITILNLSAMRRIHLFVKNIKVKGTDNYRSKRKIGVMYTNPINMRQRDYQLIILVNYIFT